MNRATYLCFQSFAGGWSDAQTSTVLMDLEEESELVILGARKLPLSPCSTLLDERRSEADSGRSWKRRAEEHQRSIEMTREHCAHRVWVLGLFASLVACVGEQRLEVAEVPSVAIAAAEAAVEGLQIVSAETESERGQVLYALSGTAGGRGYEIEITADGRVIEIETDD